MGRVFKQKSDATVYTPVAGDTLANIVATKCDVADPVITWQEVALYNWGTQETKEVARALVELLGVRTWADPDPTKWELDPARGIGKTLLLPKVMTKTGLSYTQIHKLQVKQQMPATAVFITKLDKWFLPGDQNCDISWAVEGIKARATKLDFDVYASNYCKATATNQTDFVSYAYADTPDIPIRSKPVNTNLDERSGGDINDWSGESEAADGVLKPRGTEIRYINAASSPYTVMMRYYESDAHKTALLRVQSFWPRWSGTGSTRAVVQGSLKIKWYLKDCPASMQGQFMIFDKDRNIVWRQAIPTAKCGNGDQEIDWSADGTALVQEAKMPYRVQIQIHTDKDTTPGLGLAGMHTEVRVFCHRQTGTLDPEHQNEDQVLKMKQALWLPGTAPAEDSAKGRKLRLAKAGYHPGPVMDGEAQLDYIRAIREFQRDHQKIGATSRLVNDGTIDQDTKDAIVAQVADRRPLYADAARADLTAANAVESALNGKDTAIVAWVDDRHFYTENASAGGSLKPTFYPNMDLGDYRGGMGIGDGKQTTDAATSCRPWLPVEVAIPIMRKSDELDSANVPAMNDFTRKATGPIRVDWTFRDLPLADNVDTTLYEHDRARPKKFLTNVITALKGTQDGKDAFNCPAASGGVRGASYYRAPFGYGATDSLSPWLGFDDTGNTVVCSVAHDDLGQDDDRVFATHLGKAGVYLRPSIIAGDGYQFRAQVNFRDLPGAVTHPNWKVLRDRYPVEKLPHMHTAKIRIWRKTSLRGYIPWEPQVDRFWGNGRNYETLFRVYYEPCFVHFIPESTGAPPLFTPDALFPDGLGETAYRTLIAANTGSKGANVKTSRYQPTASIVRSLSYIWPWSTHKHLGINCVPPSGTSVANYNTVHLYNSPGVYDDTWRQYRPPLIHEAIKQIELTQGVMRGHTIGEFRATPEYWVQKYYCDACSVDQLLVELTSAGGSGVGEDCRIATCAGKLITGAHRIYRCNNTACNRTVSSIPNLTGQPCTRTCTGSLSVSSSSAWLGFKGLIFNEVNTGYLCGTCGKTRDVLEPANNTGTRAGTVCANPCSGTFQPISPVRVNEIGLNTKMMGLPAAGESNGGLFLFCTYGRGVSTWAHEIAHHKHLEHGPGGGGYDPLQHDSVLSTLAPLNTFISPNNGWDRACMMGYTRTGKNANDVDRGYFCGKCILKLRGWIVETGGVNSNRPAGNVTGP